MALTITPLHPLFAAEASGLNLREPLDAATVTAINDAMNRYAVLVFRDQPLTQAEQVAFARQFGDLDSGLRKATGAKTRFEHEEIIDISNVGFNGEVTARDDQKLVNTLANQLWHSDSSFQSIVMQYSMLSAVVITERGGETEWADLRAAYDALPASTKTHISTLSAEHFAFHSRVLLGDDRYDEKQLTVMPPVNWPLVRTHPGSGRKLLFVGVHCRAIAGMHPAEARLLIAELLEHATQRRFIYRHHWRVGDFVIWDNRSTLHRGLRYDLSERRELRRTTTMQNPAENF